MEWVEAKVGLGVTVQTRAPYSSGAESFRDIRKVSLFIGLSKGTTPK